MRPVDFAWAVIALPLLATVINLLLAIPHSIALRNANAPAGGGHGAAGAHGEPDTAADHQAQNVEQDPHGAGVSPHDAHDDHGGGHGAHGGRTPFWTLFVGWIGAGLVAR